MRFAPLHLLYCCANIIVETCPRSPLKPKKRKRASQPCSNTSTNINTTSTSTSITTTTTITTITVITITAALKGQTDVAVEILLSLITITCYSGYLL